MIIDYSKRFSTIVEPGAFVLLDASHQVEFYIGLDEIGRKTLVARSKTNPGNIKSTSAIEVTVGQLKNKTWSLGFHLIPNSMSGLFYKFCDDIVESCRDNSVVIDEMSFIVKRFDSWKKLFFNMKRELLSENEIMGLIGEIVFMQNDLKNNYDTENALNAWSGYDKTHKDFSIEKLWYEIKTTKSNSLTIKISSVEQLDSDLDGFLVLFEMEKMSQEFNGYSLNNVIRAFINELNENLVDLFLEKLRACGYTYDDNYDKYVYRIVSKKVYLVNDDFPRITKENLPNSIVKIEYEILKHNISCFEVKKWI